MRKTLTQALYGGKQNQYVQLETVPDSLAALFRRAALDALTCKLVLTPLPSLPVVMRLITGDIDQTWTLSPAVIVPTITKTGLENALCF